MIPVKFTATIARVPAFAEVFFPNGAALGAHLGGITGGHEHHGATGACCLVHTHLLELSPPRIKNTLGESTLRTCSIGQVLACLFVLFWLGAFCQVQNFQLLKDDHLMLFDQLGRMLVVKITPLISNLAMRFGNLFDGLFASMGGAFLAREGLLQLL